MIVRKPHETSHSHREMHEKTRIALSSVVAAIILTGTKLIVGLWSNSLGILSEAFHSALDLIAASMTLFAVKSATKPADMDHQYGHQKIENFSALIETLLLLIIIVYVFFEAARRIILLELNINTSPITFAVVIFAIIVDYSRSRILYRTAEKFDSQALKADALHFSTDILSSSVVFGGLLFTRLGFPLGDPLGAIGVTVIVLIMTIKLGREAVGALLDRAPAGLEQRIRAAVEEVDGAISCGRIRVRKSGSINFVDAAIIADPLLPLEKAHQIGDQVKFRIEKVVGPADIMIHMDPNPSAYPLLVNNIRKEAEQFDWIKDIHKMHIFEFENQVYVAFHIRVNAEESLGDAHRRITSFEAHLKQLFPNIRRIVTHIEPFSGSEHYQIDLEHVSQRIRSLAQRTGFLKNCHGFSLFPLTSGTYNITFHCDAEPSRTVKEIHRASRGLEAEIREEMPFFSQIVIHVEPLHES